MVICSLLSKMMNWREEEMVRGRREEKEAL